MYSCRISYQGEYTYIFLCPQFTLNRNIHFIRKASLSFSSRMTFPAKVNIAFYIHITCNLIPAIYSTSLYVMTSNMRSVLYIYHNGFTLTFESSCLMCYFRDKQKRQILLLNVTSFLNHQKYIYRNHTQNPQVCA